MVDVKEAVSEASEYYKKLFGEASTAGLRLEEVELSDAGDAWYVTLSVPNSLVGALTGGLVYGNTSREYKIFKIRAEDGWVQSMKIRKAE